MSTLEAVEALIENNKFDEAESSLAILEADKDEAAEVAYYRGVVFEHTDRWPEALDAYEEAVEKDGQHREAIFQLACLLDRHGDDDRALELYERLVDEPPLHINALMNLAVLYEDAGRFDDAERCLELVLDKDPNHARARLFYKDVLSSQSMYYDEDQERVREQRNAIMDTPISDFELSVRSRNCLKQMNINTLGDLLATTESQLMAYKNFGETSLSEIKALLAQKGLYLGQLLDERPTSDADASGSAKPTLGDTGVYARPVSELELSVRARKCLQRLGIMTLGELAARSEPELLAIKNFGQTSLNEIKGRLMELGLSLRT